MKILRFIDNKFEEYILFCTLTSTVCLIFFQVIMRYVFKNSMSWTEELARYIFVWQSWISTGYAVKKSKHIRVEVLSKYLPDKSKFMLEIVIIIIWLSFSAYFAFESAKLTKSIFALHQLSPALQIPMGYVYASVPAGCILMSIRLIQEITMMFKNKIGGAKQ